MTWSDVRTIALDQAIYLLFGDRTGAERTEEKRIDARVRWLIKHGAAAGKTGRQLRLMGPHAIVALLKEQTGQDVDVGHIYPLMDEPEFQ